MLARVSNIEAFRRWSNWQPLHDNDEEPSLADLVRQITTDEPSEAMRAGTAFHKALETAEDGTHYTLEALGYTFRLADGSITLPAVRELRAYGVFGGLHVTGQVDGLHGKEVTDHKTTSRFDPERYLNGCQWKFYLDLFDANVFRWNVFELKELGEREYGVAPPHALTAYRYPELHDDCVKLAAAYLEFARKHLPRETNVLLAG